MIKITDLEAVFRKLKKKNGIFRQTGVELSDPRQLTLALLEAFKIVKIH
jgi:hypothetical protein